MSRIGKKPIEIPSGVNITLDGKTIRIKGPKGEMQWTYPERIAVTVGEGKVVVNRSGDLKADRSLHGLTRSLISNMVTGVSEGFQRKLELVGVGYRASMQGKDLNLSLGFSHPVVFTTPEGITIETPTQTEVLVKGADKQRVGEVAAKIRGFRPPEPYKGKGVRYQGEQIRRKTGKAGAK